MAQEKLITLDKLSTFKDNLDIISQASLDGKVDKVSGKGLSTNDYTTAEKTKLSGIATGAEVNVQSDWNQTNSSNDDFIKNKPTLGTAAAKNSTNAVTDGSTDLVESGAVFDNTQDVYEVMGKNGAKNLLPMTLANIKAMNTGGTWSGNVYTYKNISFEILTDNANNVIGIKVNRLGTPPSNYINLFIEFSSALTGSFILTGPKRKVRLLPVASV